MNMADVSRSADALQGLFAYFFRVDAQPSSGPPSAAVEREAGSIDGSSIGGSSNNGSGIDAWVSKHLAILSV